MPPTAPLKSGSLVPHQQLDCLRIAAPFYWEAWKEGDMNFFLEDFFIHYFKRFPIPCDEFPTVQAREAEKWEREKTIFRQLDWLRNIGLHVILPTTWRKFVALDPSPEYADIAVRRLQLRFQRIVDPSIKRNILDQLSSTKTPKPTLRESSDDLRASEEALAGGDNKVHP
ncbi:hypothetical protein BKA70DRAFT_1221907 [Coprinopsis sp. MPI-PUGE-AT-0042]|nr:hypothetical protein BKA70DRAFT_1221907 [Coprinopsis sp. MPI-PUGE-AT-0042]